MMNDRCSYKLCCVFVSSLALIIFKIWLFILITCSIAFYRFQRGMLNVSTDVSTVYAVCSRNNEYCLLSSMATSTQLPIETTNNNIALANGSDCVVNFVEIIHDCLPRCVDMKLRFRSYETNYLYLQVKNLVHTSIVCQ